LEIAVFESARSADRFRDAGTGAFGGVGDQTIAERSDIERVFSIAHASSVARLHRQTHAQRRGWAGQVNHVAEAAELIRKQPSQAGAGRGELEPDDREHVGESIEEHEDLPGDRAPRRRWVGMHHTVGVEAGAGSGEMARVRETRDPSAPAAD
jgi:hypothetical protein